MGLLMARRRDHQCANFEEWENEGVARSHSEQKLKKISRVKLNFMLKELSICNDLLFVIHEFRNFHCLKNLYQIS